MATVNFPLSRIEGGGELVRIDEGPLRLMGGRYRNFEHLLTGRPAQEAVYLVQQISADSGIAHALAFLSAWEAAGKIEVSKNGRTARLLLELLSILHGNLRHFYLQVLPDYLPPESLASYAGRHPEVLRMKSGLRQVPRTHWLHHQFPAPLSAADSDLLWEHLTEAHRVMEMIRRMIAILGGKFPVIMSLVPGGLSLSLKTPDLLNLWANLKACSGFLETTPFEDGALLVSRWPELKSLGQTADDYLSVGSGADASDTDGALFPSGILISDKLEPYNSVVTESLRRSYYRIPTRLPEQGGVPQAQPDKKDAYSWIKAPRFQGRPLETGSLARLLISDLSGGKVFSPNMAQALRRVLGAKRLRSGGVAGRMMGRLVEMSVIAEKIGDLIELLESSQPMLHPTPRDAPISGEARGYSEAPAGAVHHRVILEKGRISHLDIISPSTWNGTPVDEKNQAGPIEMAINKEKFNLAENRDRLSLSRIVHSFAFSLNDAIH